jgi:hypothetical protein
MAFSPPPWSCFMGLNLQGDIGGWTFYSGRHGELVLFPATTPTKPPTWTQQIIQQRFAQAGRQWSALPAQVKAQWEAISKRARLRINGCNLWTYYVMTQDRSAIATVARQAGLPNPIQ